MCRSSVQHVTKLAAAATRQSFMFGSGNVRQTFAAWDSVDHSLSADQQGEKPKPNRNRGFSPKT